MADDAPLLPVLLYDGDCAFCSSCARLAERWVPGPTRLVPWQQVDLDRLGVRREQAEEAVVWVASPTDHTAGPEAIADLLRSSRPWWRVLGRILGWRPVLAVAWPAYHWVSAHRHRFPGGTPACSLPSSERGTDG